MRSRGDTEVLTSRPSTVPAPHSSAAPKDSTDTSRAESPTSQGDAKDTSHAPRTAGIANRPNDICSRSLRRINASTTAKTGWSFYRSSGVMKSPCAPAIAKAFVNSAVAVADAPMPISAIATLCAGGQRR